VCKAESAQLFKPLFIEAMEDETDSVRLSAAEGLIYIDPAQGLGILRNYTGDKSLAVQKKIITLAGKVGGVEDLNWLVEKTRQTNGSRTAWDSMLRIFTDAETSVLKNWMDRLSEPETIGNLSDEQIISFYEIADRKAEAAKQLEIQKVSKSNLAKLYQKTGSFEQAAKQLGWLWENAETLPERQDLFARQLEVYWSWANLEGVKGLISNSLAKGDLDPNGVVAGSIEKNLSEPLGGLDAGAILKILETIQTSDLIRPNWKKKLDGWKQRFSDSDKAGS
ncbi:HEAT repeat domain-containing protein, partial [Planctomycetota bacterium]